MKTLKQTVLEGLMDRNANLNSLLHKLEQLYKPEEYGSILGGLRTRIKVPDSKLNAFRTECLKLKDFIETTYEELPRINCWNIGEYKYIVHIYNRNPRQPFPGFQFYDVKSKIMINLSSILKRPVIDGIVSALQEMNDAAVCLPFDQRKYFEIPKELFQSVLNFYQSMRKK